MLRVERQLCLGPNTTVAARPDVLEDGARDEAADIRVLGRVPPLQLPWRLDHGRRVVSAVWYVAACS